jgi:biotin-(acetyl-CoA carboxylase) ligase
VASLQREYRERSLVLGRAVSLTVGGSAIRGVVEDVSPVEGLVLRGDDGVLVHVRAEHASEVRLADVSQVAAPLPGAHQGDPLGSNTP